MARERPVVQGFASLLDSAALDSLPPSPPAISAAAPGDIYPVGSHERDLCDRASHPDWLYLGGLVAIEAGGLTYGSVSAVRDSSSLAVRMLNPGVVGLTWGMLVGGVWLTLPQCNAHWVGTPPREGNVRASWPLALALAALAGVTAPIIDGIVVGQDPPPAGTPVTNYYPGWTTLEREMHLVTAGVAGFAGALLPYLVPPRTWSAARELDHLRFGADARGGVSLGYSLSF
jgi:hypothetical protein